jgi:tetratricopeptide (TPR) repeat protein
MAAVPGAVVYCLGSFRPRTGSFQTEERTVVINSLRILALILLLGSFAVAQDYASLNNKGNDSFKEGEYKDALDYYNQAEIERPETPEITYNQGNALMKMGNYEEAVEKLQHALNTDNAELQADAYFNLGNGFFEQERFQNAIQMYQKTLEIRPDDLDAKFNLELARNRLKEQMKPENEENKEQKEQEQKEDKQEQKDQDQGEDNKQQQQEQKQQQSEENESEQQPNPDEKQEGKQPKPEEMSREDAMRILRALRETDKENQEKVRRAEVKGSYSGNDW